jgi:hypothetical protein
MKTELPNLTFVDITQFGQIKDPSPIDVNFPIIADGAI